MKAHMSTLRKRLASRAAKQHQSASMKIVVVAVAVTHKGEITNIKTNALRLSKYGGGLHAEHRVLISSPKNIKTVIIARYGRSGNLLPVHPCEGCKKLARKLGIEIVSLS